LVNAKPVVISSLIETNRKRIIQTFVLGKQNNDHTMTNEVNEGNLCKGFFPGSEHFDIKVIDTLLLIS